MAAESWGRFPRVASETFALADLDAPLPALKGPVLPFGLGRSYGDVCLVEGGTTLLTSRCARISSFDEVRGIIRCQSGASLQDVIARVAPHWFPPVVPGTRHVTIGGAIANDIHGKNHHLAGTFGSQVLSFGLRRTSGELLQCSEGENRDLFRATIGGLGLTGVITTAEFKLAPMASSTVHRETLPFGSVAEFVELSNELQDRPYIVGWLDCLAPRSRQGRGVLFAGSHSPRGVDASSPRRFPAVPAPAPTWLLNRFTARAFNSAYRLLHRAAKTDDVHYESFFFPLDSVPQWNLLYGSAGFLQWQCLVPPESALCSIEQVLTEVRCSGEGAYLGVIKVFGDSQSPGMLSFPRKGITLAMDFPIRGERTFTLLDRLDAILLEGNGGLYAAKDARMSPAMFKQSNRRLAEFLPHRDPGIRSRMWNRVMEGAPL